MCGSSALVSTNSISRVLTRRLPLHLASRLNVRLQMQLLLLRIFNHNVLMEALALIVYPVLKFSTNYCSSWFCLVTYVKVRHPSGDSVFTGHCCLSHSIFLSESNLIAMDLRHQTLVSQLERRVVQPIRSILQVEVVDHSWVWWVRWFSEYSLFNSFHRRYSLALMSNF